MEVRGAGAAATGTTATTPVAGAGVTSITEAWDFTGSSHPVLRSSPGWDNT